MNKYEKTIFWLKPLYSLPLKIFIFFFIKKNPLSQQEELDQIKSTIDHQKRTISELQTSNEKYIYRLEDEKKKNEILQQRYFFFQSTST